MVMVSLLALVVHRLDCNEMGAVTKCAWFGRRNMPDAAGGSDGRQVRLGVTAQTLRMWCNDTEGNCNETVRWL